MQSNKFNFTKKVLENLPQPDKGKRAYYYDTKVRGLGIAVTDKGTKTFIVYRKVNGKPERVTLGHFPALSIENARGLSSEVNAQIARGMNPNKERRKIKDELLFSQLFTEFMDKHSTIHKKSTHDDKSIYRRYLTHLGNRKISTIHKMDIEKLHITIGKNNGIYAANSTLRMLKTVFNKAIGWGWEGINPCNGIKLFKEKSRDRFLQGDELPGFFEALNNEPNEVFRDFFYICLLTGARRSNVLAMNWNDINLERGIWRIQETKNGEAQTIPLPNEAVKILEERKKTRINDWVFPSATSSSGHIQEPKKVWKRILERANIKDLRIHDLRRTLGSWQAATGANSFIIGKSLGHKTQAATAIYARLNLDPVRDSMSKAISAMLSCATSKD